MSSADAVLEFDDVRVVFGGLTALAGVSFSLVPGELLAVVGPNGAGKSTLLNAASGLVNRHLTGDIRLAGRSTTSMQPHRIAALGLGRSFQSPPLVDDESVLENVLAGAHASLGYGLATQVFRPRAVRQHEEATRSRAQELLATCGLGSMIDHDVESLPYGSRKLVDIARAIVSEPSVVLLDEPTSGLDVAEQDLVHELLRIARQTEGLSVLVVEHHMDFVRRIADRVVGLQAGAVIAIGTPTEVLDSPQFRAALVGRTHDTDDSPSSSEPAPAVSAAPSPREASL